MARKDLIGFLIMIIMFLLFIIALVSMQLYIADLEVQKLRVPQPTPTLTFAEQWGYCSLHMVCAQCLERERRPGITSGLSVCWEEINMDEHMEIFERD